MRTRSLIVALFAVSLATACGYDPHPRNGGLGPDGGGGNNVDGAVATGRETGAGEAGKLVVAEGGTGIDGSGMGGIDVAGATGGVETGGEAAGPYDVALDKPEDVPALAIDGGKDAGVGANGGAGGASGAGGTGGIGGASGDGKDAPIATGGAVGGASGDGGASDGGSSNVRATGGASTSPDAAATGGASGSGGSQVGSGGAGTGGATGSPPDIEPSTTTLTLGDAPMGESSGEGTFTLTNLGQQTSAPIHIASTSPDFVIRATGNDTCISDTTTLAQNASCTVRVVLTPASLGSKSAFITFQAGSGASGHIIVSGTATPGASLSTGSTTTISFPLLATAGVASPVTSFTVTNVGPRTSGTLSAASDNPDFAVQPGAAGDCTGASLLPNGSCTVRVVMTPSTSGSISGKISVSAAPGGTASVTASGTSCAANAHNDGTGTCGTLYSCGANYHNGGTDKCVPNQTCPNDQLTDDNGTCVPMAGVNWVKRTIQASAVAISSDGRKLIATYPQHAYTSINGGQDWTEHTLPSAEAWQAATSSADGTKIEVFGPSSIYSSTDSGATWSLVGSGFTLGSNVASSADGSTLVTGYNGFGIGAGGIRYSLDYGKSWSYHAINTYYLATSVAMSANGTTIVVGDDYEISVSNDSAQSWQVTGYNAGYYTGGAVGCSADGIRMLAVGYLLVTSTDSGQSWSGVNSAVLVNRNESGASATVSSNGKVVAYGGGSTGAQLVFSRDGGASWISSMLTDVKVISSSASGTTLVAVSGDYVYTSSGPVP